MNKPLMIGQLVGVHGLHGDIKMQVFTDNVSMLLGLHEVQVDQKTCEIVSIRPYKSMALIRFRGIDSPEEARPLLLKNVFAPREALPPLPEGRFWAEDILGLSVVSEQNGAEEDLGVITDIFQTGSNDVYEVTKGAKKTLIPAIRAVVLHIDLDAGKMRIYKMPGLFDDEI